jgi:segregation and condensation protein B
MNLAQQIIHLLLYTGDSMPVKNIANSLHTSVAEVESVEQEVRESLEGLALKLLVQNNEWMISIDKTFAKSLQKQENKETLKPLSESALQTLAVIIYKNGATKAEIDFVRGVDSGRSLKTLNLRGLIVHEDRKSKKVYLPTLDTLTYLGIENLEDFPNFAAINSQLRMLLDQE